MPKRIFHAATRSFTAPAVRYPPDPRALFVLFLCVMSGFPLIFASATPGSIAAQMPQPAIIVWGLMLTVGALMTMVGALRQTVNGVITEQVGSVSLGFACVIYAGAIWWTIRWTGTIAICLTLGFGLASFWRWGQLQSYLRAVEHLAQEIRDEEE